jgi:hypothetical protein
MYQDDNLLIHVAHTLDEGIWSSPGGHPQQTMDEGMIWVPCVIP